MNTDKEIPKEGGVNIRKHCPVCGGGAPHATKANQEICGKCAELSPMGQYELLVKRLDDHIERAQALCNQAYKEGDQESVWFAQSVIKDLGRQKAKLRKPEKNATTDEHG